MTGFLEGLPYIFGAWFLAFVLWIAVVSLTGGSSWGAAVLFVGALM